MTAIVVDLDGVMYLGDQAIPGACRALDACERAGSRIWFATNSSLRTPEAAAAKVRTVTGYQATPEQMITSALAAAWVVGTLDASTALVIGEAGVRSALIDKGVQVVDDPWAAEAVVVGLDREVHYGLLRDATLAVRNGATFVATNLDPSYPMPDGQWPGAGAIVDLIRVASETDPIAAGKPERPMIDLITSRIGPGADVWMVGDRPSTDLAMAKRAGWRSALVLTGVVDSLDQVPDEWKPDFVLDSIAGLPDELERVASQSINELPPHR